MAGRLTLNEITLLRFVLNGNTAAQTAACLGTTENEVRQRLRLILSRRFDPRTGDALVRPVCGRPEPVEEE